MNTTTADPAAAAFALPEATALAAAPLEGAALNPVPGLMDVLREQFSAVGLALQREGMVVGGFAALFTAFIAWVQLTSGSADMPLSPMEGIAAVMMALLIPMAVWKGEDPSRRGYHHAMPVDHGAHAIAKGAAGLAWTLAGVVAFFGWMGLLTVITDGRVENVDAWRWLAPFAGATIMYLLGSALTLATSRPWRWLGGGAVAFVFINAFRGNDATRPLADLADSIFTGHYGLSTVLTGLVDSPIHRGLVADFGAWLTATFLWLAAAISVFLWAAYRQPEQ